MFRSILVGRLSLLTQGEIVVADGDWNRRFGTPDPTGLSTRIEIKNRRVYMAVVLGGSVGAAEAYANGWWTAVDLTMLIRIIVRNRKASVAIDGWSTRLAMLVHRIRHRLRLNRKRQSRRNISAHYDLGNEFFSLFLDTTMTYSCAIFQERETNLEQASRLKLDLICRKLQLSPDDHLLEIGSGWGSLALHAASAYGCEVTTTTISDSQYDYVCRQVESVGMSSRIHVIKVDYRDLPQCVGRRFEKVASVEMIEAVGYEYLDTYFEICDRLTAPGGKMFLQSIVISDDLYDSYTGAVDVIQRYIFPGGFLPSRSDLRRRIGSQTKFELSDLVDITDHYPRTLRLWRGRFHENWDRFTELGYPERLLRLWVYYFCYCEGGFLEQAVGNVQLLLTKQAVLPESSKQVS